MKNVLQLAMIVKDSADTIVECLESWKPVISYWVILDTGSQDATKQLILKTMEGIPGKLYEEPFKGFSESRNRCLDLIGRKCKYTVMPDDSYILQGAEQLIDQLNNKRAPVVTINIQIKNEKYPDITSEYISKRITLSKCKIRYIGKIHEDIEYAADYHLKGCYIVDQPKGSQHERTLKRKEYDLMQLGSSPRDVYYKGMTYITMKQNDKAVECFRERVAMNDKDHEEKFICYINIGHLTRDVREYILAAMEFPARSGEAYFFIYLLTENLHYLNKAYENRKLGKCRLPVERSIYEKFIPEIFEKKKFLRK